MMLIYSSSYVFYVLFFFFLIFCLFFKIITTATTRICNSCCCIFSFKVFATRKKSLHIFVWNKRQTNFKNIQLNIATAIFYLSSSGLLQIFKPIPFSAAKDSFNFRHLFFLGIFLLGHPFHNVEILIFIYLSFNIFLSVFSFLVL